MLSDLDESEEIYSAMLHSHMNIIEKLITISDDRLDFFRKNYEVEKRKIIQAYEKDMTDYKNKKFQLQKELESVYYGSAERTLKTTKTAEEEFLQKQDELKNSVSYSNVFCMLVIDSFTLVIALQCCTLMPNKKPRASCILKNNSFIVPIAAVHFSAFSKALN